LLDPDTVRTYVDIKNAGINHADDAIYFYSGPDGRSIAFTYDTTSGRDEIVEHTVTDFTWPNDGAGIVVHAAQSATVDHDITGTVPLYYERLPALQHDKSMKPILKLFTPRQSRQIFYSRYNQGSHWLARSMRAYGRVLDG